MYQDNWIKGRCVNKGIRECELRYDPLLKIARGYSRPFTMLDIGANDGYFSIRTAEDFGTSVIVAIEPSVESLIKNIELNELKNIIVLRKKLDIANLFALATCESFDIIVAFGIIHAFSEPLIDVYRALSSLGGILALEVPTEKQSLGSKYDEVQYLLSQLGKPNIEIPSHVDSEKKRPIFIQERKINVPMFTRFAHPYPFYGNVYGDRSTKVFHVRNETRNYIPGINLYTYLMLDGIYPTRKNIIKQIEDMDIETIHDFKAWNFVLSGDRVFPIDTEDHRGNCNSTEEDRTEVLKRLKTCYI